MADRVHAPYQLKQVLQDSRTPVAKICQAINDCIDANRNNLRPVFEQCLTVLLNRLYGFESTPDISLLNQTAARVRWITRAGCIAADSIAYLRIFTLGLAQLH